MTITREPSRQRRGVRIGQTEVVLGLVLVALVSQQWLIPLLSNEALGAWSTMFVAIIVQAVPFLVLGVLLAGVISHFITDRALERVVPRDAKLGVPAAGLAGVALPGCECASVPVSASLIRRGVAPAVALTFMLAAPAVNPVVLVSTAVAFPDQPMIVLARFCASMLTAVLIGWLWLWRGGMVPMRMLRTGHEHGGTFLGSVQHDFLHAAGFLVLGGALAAVVNVFVPREVLDSVAGNVVLGIVTMAIFAFVVAMCSEADAFVAASLTAFSDTAKLVFMVVGPAMDIKLASMQAGTFGRGFALVFVPVVIGVATLCAVGVGELAAVSATMTRTTQALVLTLVGATLVRLTLTDAYLRYVNEWMRWPLLASGVLLVGVALVRVLRPAEQAPEHEGEHEGEHAEESGGISNAAWLLLAPVLVVFTISPPALGAYSAERASNELPASAAEDAELPLPPSVDGQPVEIEVVDFVVRVQYDEARSLQDRDVSLVGFVSSDDDGNWYVSRMSMNCCAADASATRVMVTGAEAPPRNSWVRVTGEWDPLDGGPPESAIAAADVVEVDQPRNPYG